MKKEAEAEYDAWLRAKVEKTLLKTDDPNFKPVPMKRSKLTLRRAGKRRCGTMSGLVVEAGVEA